MKNLLFLCLMREVKQVSQFFSLFLKTLTEAGRFIIFGSHKGDKRADTDLMFQFCFPNQERQILAQNIFFM